ncbi:hypothetical protein FB45DRAFT_699691, partial [Roridomyces roridus]
PPESSVSQFVVIGAESLPKRDLFRLPSPFAFVTVDSEQKHVTSVDEESLHPLWNQIFDL